MPIELQFLGTGTSMGIPMIGCACAVCRSDDPRDRRDRASVLIRYPDPSMPELSEEHRRYDASQAGLRQVLIDASPDLRHQAIRAGISRLDAVMITHAHADHIFGLDDLRRFNATMQEPLDLYAEPGVIDQLQHKLFNYIFEPHKNVNQSFIAKLIAHRLEPGEAMPLFGTRWTPLRLMHGRLPILGFRVETDDAAIAYCTDVSTIPPETYPHLEGLDVLVIDALRYRHHPTHLTIDRALSIIDELQPRRAYFTHLAHDVCHATLDAELPDHVSPAHDGLILAVGSKPEWTNPGGGP
jgi:phosphoribosyl 1,2-cyclic phosphate phosphodiesterase